jgi:transposase
MPAPLSLDLRKRIFAFRERTGASFEETAAHFDVGEATVNRLFALYRATGSLDPKHATGGLPALIADDELPVLREIVDADNDATLKDICAAWLKKFGKKIAVSTMYRALSRAGITLKKSPSRPPSASVRTSSSARRRSSKNSKHSTSIDSSSSTSAV